MEKEHSFQIKRVGSKLKKFSISRSATYSDLDEKICDLFGYDTWDHCRAFFIGKPWKGVEVATIHPDGSGTNEEEKISNLITNEKISYVYDFGDDIRHEMKLLN